MTITSKGTILTVLLWAGSAVAGPTQQQLCQTLKTTAVRGYTSCRLTAEKFLAKTGDTVRYDKKITTCENRFAAAWQRAIDKAAPAMCLDAPLVATDFKTVIDGFCGNVATALSGGGLSDCPQGQTCGDGIIESGEDCDFGHLGGNTCASLGFLGGTLACGAGCAFDTSKCFQGITVPFTSTPSVVVDGQIDGPEWAGAWSSNVTFFSLDEADGPIQCDVHLIHDGTFLYVAVATPLSAGWDSKVRLRIDGNDSGCIDGSATTPYVDIGDEQGSPGAWSGYTGYRALITDSGCGGDVNWLYVPPGAGEQKASAGSTNVSYEFKIPLADLAVSAGAKVRFVLTASPNATQMWFWPYQNERNKGDAPRHPWAWTELTLANP